MKKVKINNQFDIVLPKHRAERPEWFREEGWEKKRLQSMYKHIGSGDVVYYIGAEEGEMPALCQMWGAKVIMFEPNDRVWPNIKAIWNANKLDPPLGCFVGFASDKTFPPGNFIDVERFPACADGEVIGDHGFKELNDAGNIAQVKIDDVTGAMMQVEKKLPTVISLDVEGSEWNVLKGAEETLKMLHPKIWLSLHPEFMFRIYGTYQFELRKWIKDFGYKEELLDYQHEVHLFYYV